LTLIGAVQIVATIRQYFDTDFSRLLKTSRLYRLSDGVVELDVPVNLHNDFDANAKFLSCFVPLSGKPLSACVSLIAMVDQFLSIGDGVEVGCGLVGERPMDSNALQFCGRFFVYSEEDLSEPELERLINEAEAKHLFIQVRGPQFAYKRAQLETPLAFICHDSRDKDEIARPLAIELSRRMCPVWYDEFSLKLGHPLRESIERGLKECKKCILVLSKNFLSNRGWTKTEFNAVFTREVLEQACVVLPIWCGIEKSELFAYSPTLLDRVGVNWARGLQEVAREIQRALV
jgi:hypothetical protein